MMVYNQRSGLQAYIIGYYPSQINTAYLDIVCLRVCMLIQRVYMNILLTSPRLSKGRGAELPVIQ